MSEELPEWAKPSAPEEVPSWAAGPATTATPEKPARPATMDVAQNALYGGAAAIPDALLNAPNQLENLARSVAGSGALAVGAKDLASKLEAGIKEDPDLVRKLLEKTGLIKKGITPQGVQKALDVLLRGGMGGALTGGSSIPKAAMGAGMGALASGAGAAGGGLAKSLGADESTQNVASSTAGLLAPRGAAAVAGTLPRAATERGPQIPPERLDAYRDMTAKGARPSASSLIYGEQNKNVQGQQRVANETWNESVGLPKKQDFGTKEVSQAKTNLSADYERLLNGREVTFDKPFFDKFKSLYDKQRMLSETGVTFAEARPIIATLERIANLPESIKQRIGQIKDIPPDTTSPGAAKRALAVIDDAMAAGAAGEWKMNAKDYNEVRSILGKDAQRSRRDKNKSGLLWKMQQAFDDAADRSMPDIAKDLGATRGRYENLMILSDAMEGRGAGFVTPAQIGKEVAQREGHRSLYPTQVPLKQLGRHGLSLSGDSEIGPASDLRGIGVHMAPGIGANLTALQRALSTPVTALRARGMGKEGFYESAKRREAELKEAARRSIIPLEAESK